MKPLFVPDVTPLMLPFTKQAVQLANPTAESGGERLSNSKIKHLVLVLNAHQANKLATARKWLELIPQLPLLESVGLVVLGQVKRTLQN